MPLCRVELVSVVYSERLLTFLAQESLLVSLLELSFLLETLTEDHFTSVGFHNLVFDESLVFLAGCLD